MIDRLDSDVDSDKEELSKDKNDVKTTNVNELNTAFVFYFAHIKFWLFFRKLRVNLLDERKATIVYNSLNVDKEPKRSNAIRTLSVDKTFLVAYVIFLIFKLILNLK